MVEPKYRNYSNRDKIRRRSARNKRILARGNMMFNENSLNFEIIYLCILATLGFILKFYQLFGMQDK
jgi:hypothetical protein